jgi:hypothetical protein
MFVRGLADHRSRRVGTGPAGSHVDDHGYLRRENRLDDVPHRRAQPARGVELDHHRLEALTGAPVDRVLDVVGRHRVDVVLERDQQHARGFRPLRGDAEARKRGEPGYRDQRHQAPQEKPPIHSLRL